MMNPMAGWWYREIFGGRKFCGKSCSQRRKTPLGGLKSGMESLEIRSMLSASPVPPVAATVATGTYRTYDGTGNNVAHAQWGSTAEDLLRVAPAAYSDGISAPAGATRPSAREVSNVIADHVDEDVKNDRQMSAMIYAWGQFIDHDIDLTSSAKPTESFSIKVPKGDPIFDPLGTGTKTISLSRSEWDAATGTSKTNPRQQLNDITAYLDGSMVYGSDATTAASLRTMKGGLLKTSAGNLLPYASDGVMYQAGDVRANENVELTSLQTLFVREHNRIAAQLQKDHPTWSDEQLYQEARRWVIGEIQAITYNEFLPALLGVNAIRGYQGYNPNVNAGIATEFSTAAFRVGHTLLGNDVGFLDNNGNDVHEEVSLSESQFNPGLVKTTGIDPILKYLASDQAEEVDTQIVDSLRNYLFTSPGNGGLDLASLNIQRGRDHGLSDYNTTRAAYGLPKVTSFAQITPDVTLQQKLKQLYGTVDNIDLWVGGLAEQHAPGSSVGVTFQRIIADQFQRIRAGDRFWYQNTFSGADLDKLNHTSLADIIRRNTTTTNLQDNVFFFRTSISGQVFGDANKDGVRNPGEVSLAGRTIQLLDSAGTVLETALTDSNGVYHFDNLELGTYRVKEVLPAGAVQVKAPTLIALTRGMMAGRQDFAEARVNATMPPKPGQPGQPGQPQRQTPPPPQPMKPAMVDQVFTMMSGPVRSGPQVR